VVLVFNFSWLGLLLLVVLIGAYELAIGRISAVQAQSGGQNPDDEAGGRQAPMGGAPADEGAPVKVTPAG
jgi:hypothetical protein